jgi:hypothetical protein
MCSCKFPSIFGNQEHAYITKLLTKGGDSRHVAEASRVKIDVNNCFK